MPPKKAMGKGGKAPPEPAADDGAERALMESELLVAYMKSKLGRWGRCDVGGLCFCACVRMLVKPGCVHAHVHARVLRSFRYPRRARRIRRRCGLRYKAHPYSGSCAGRDGGPAATGTGASTHRCKHARAHPKPARLAAQSHAQQHKSQHPRPQVPGQWGQAAAGEPAPGRGPGHPAPQPAGHQRVPHERAEGAVPDHQRAGGQAARPDQGHGGGAQEQRGGGGAHAGAERAHGRSCSRSRTH